MRNNKRKVLSSSSMFGKLNHTELIRNYTIILVPTVLEWFKEVQ